MDTQQTKTGLKRAFKLVKVSLSIFGGIILLIIILAFSGDKKNPEVASVATPQDQIQATTSENQSSKSIPEAKPVTKKEIVSTETAKPVAGTPTEPDKATVLSILKKNASDKWKDDYEMVKYEYDQQVEAYNWVTTQTKYPEIMTKAKKKWGYDYTMVQYEYKQQVKAFEAL